MSMQPYSQNPIEVKKQQVRKDARIAAIGGGVGLVSLPLLMFVETGFALLVVIGFVVAGIYGFKVQRAISDKSGRQGY